MSNIVQKAPSFVFGYWRPWKDNSNLFDSYFDYVRDVSLVNYTTNTVRKYIDQSSQEQVQAIHNLGQAIGLGMDVLNNQISNVNESLIFLNRNIDILIEQQKLQNLLLQNITELLRVPDSQKERQHRIELGVKFFVNAAKDSDLYADALEELLKAETFMKQDYFVLHRIGCIYLYVEKYIDPEKARNYFLRAAKYASVESDSTAARLTNVLTNNFNKVNSELNNSEIQIGLLAADSYEKAAFASYILGNFTDAVNYQSKAYKFNNTPQNQFILAKYQVRNGEITEGVKNLSHCIEKKPVYAVAAFKEIDLINENAVLNLISSKNQIIDSKINNLLEDWKKIKSIQSPGILKQLTELSQKSYEIKVSQFKSLKNKTKDIEKNIITLESTIDLYISNVKQTTFCSYDSVTIIDELLNAKDLPLEQMQNRFDEIKLKVESDKLKIGSFYAGGIVFYIDQTGNHGLVCADEDFGRAIWGRNGKIRAEGNGIADGHGVRNTKLIVEQASWFEFGFILTTKKPAPTAARLCLESSHNGFTDWYLPTRKELQLMHRNLKTKGIGKFTQDGYWSSTEDGRVDNRARYVGFASRTAFDSSDHKDSPKQVRAVRAF